MNHFFTRTAMTLLGLIAAAGALAAYPEKPIALVVPFPAGATTDTIARIVAEGMAQELGTAVIVENKPGAEGQIAAQDIARAQPDGYRVMLATSGNLSVLPALRKSPPFDVLRDFTPVADVGRYAFFLYVHPSVPARSVKEFIAYARTQSDKLNYGTGNNTGVLTFASLAAASGLKLAHVPYKGEPPAMQDLVGGNIQAMIGTAIGMPHVKADKLRVLATLLPDRSALAPEVPTMAEAGAKNLDASAWAGIVGPAGMSEAVVDKLNSAVNATLAKPDVLKKMEPLGFALTPSTSAEFSNLVQNQLKVYADLVSKSGMEPQ